MSPPASGPATSPAAARRWGFSFWLKIALGCWALAFVTLVVPLTVLNAWKVGSLPVVEGTLSDHRIVHVERERPKRIESSVEATLEFDRPSDNGVIHCKHDAVTIGGAHNPDSFATRADLAVRRDSCHDYTFLPLHAPSVTEWMGIFLAVCLCLFILTALLVLALRAKKPAGLRGARPGSGGEPDFRDVPK